MKLNKKFILLLSIFLIGFMVLGCGEPAPPADDVNDVGDPNDVNDGDEPAADVEVYTGEAEGGHGPVIVEVTLDDGEIVDIEVVQHNETEGLGDDAFEQLIPQIIEAQSTEGIDVVSGATVSSEALFEAVNDALSKAYY